MAGQPQHCLCGRRGPGLSSQRRAWPQDADRFPCHISVALRNGARDEFERLDQKTGKPDLEINLCPSEACKDFHA